MENWHNSYVELTEFIKTHPSIEISPSVMTILDEVRPEFYRLFDRVRASYVADKYQMLPAAYQLSANFKEAKTATMADLNLKEIDVNPHLGGFLLDPVDGLMSKLFEPLFGLLQGKTTLETFDQLSAEIISRAAKTFSHQGYSHWTVLSIIRMLKPDNAEYVMIADQTTEPDLTSADTRPGWYTDEIPKLGIIERLALDFSLHTAFIVPRVILHSDIPEAFVSISTDIHEVYRKAKDISKRMEWYKIEEIRRDFGMGNLWPDITVNTDASAEDLRVTADYSSISRPDIIVDIMEPTAWFHDAGLERVRRHNKILNPRIGTYVVSRYPSAIPEENQSELSHRESQDLSHAENVTEQSLPSMMTGFDKVIDNIHILDVGFDASKLAPIIDALRR